MTLLLTSVFLLFLSAILYRDVKKRNLPLLSVNADGDEDMKIAGNSFRASPIEDPAEAEASRFLRHKSVGNIEKARQLGRALAEALMDCGKTTVIGEPAKASQLEYHHRLLLCAYIINSVIVKYSPDSILAQTSSSVFNDEIERDSPELFRQISDPAAFSLYILLERSNQRDAGEIGRLYARLCGMENDASIVEDGNRLYSWFMEKCAGISKAVDYQPA